MVTIVVHDLVSGDDSVEEGRIVSAALDGAIAADEDIVLSFHGVGSASSSFVSASIIPLLRRVGIEEFKWRVRVPTHHGRLQTLFDVGSRWSTLRAETPRQTKRAARKPPPPQPTYSGTHAEGDSRRAFVDWLTHAAKAGRRPYNATVVSQWPRALTPSTSDPIESQQKGRPKPPLSL